MSIQNEQTTCYIHRFSHIFMVITTRMFHQITSEGKNDKLPKNPDVKIIESFLKNSQEFEDNQKVIASHS